MIEGGDRTDVNSRVGLCWIGACMVKNVRPRCGKMTSNLFHLDSNPRPTVYRPRLTPILEHRPEFLGGGLEEEVSKDLT